eukprot:GILI01008791.1.p1 GENE.GILI01008791.1~~GILI01008791.1.p1  ORF type:complete len:1212 (+),score=195.94 GILI01008791.1:517-3636(+)
MTAIVSVIKDDPRYSTSLYKFFAFNTVEASEYQINGNTSIFDNWYIAKHSPSYKSNTTAATEFLSAFGNWLSSDAFSNDSLTFLATDITPTQPSEAAFFTYISTRYVIELIALAAASKQCHNGQVPLASAVLDMAYTSRIYVGGIVYHPLVRKCPDKPLVSACFCNVAARVTYTFKVNGSTGKLDQIIDDSFEGKAGYATTVVPSDTCTPDYIDNSNYPITLSLLIPTGEDIEAAMNSIMGSMCEAVNNAVPRPARPFRAYMAIAPDVSEIDNEYQGQINSRVQPFMTAMSMGNSINVSSKLLVFPNANIQILEDPPLRKYELHDENMLITLPTVADSLFACIAYYAQNADSYTSIIAFTSTEVEAAIMLKTLHTFQIDISVLVVTDPDAWQPTLLRVGSSSSNPFVVISSWNNDELVEAAMNVRYVQRTGVFALATFEGDFFQNNYKSIVGDIFIVSFLPEWWVTTSSLKQYLAALQVQYPYDGDDPTLYLPAVVFGLCYLVAQQATAASWAASTVLYQIGTISVADITFGPYSNATCTDAQIAANDRNRNCQCYKGPRTFYVHSIMNINDRIRSNRTGNFRYTMTTCGVVYQALIPKSSSKAIDDGALAAIAAAAAVVVFAVVGGTLLFTCCFYGKKHWHAPTDSSKPFAMLFTDIQNSTGLWSRAPAAMSESVSLHHSLIRKLVTKYSGYEVKTIGDSFMVAFKDVNNAALLALDIQSVFYDATWPSEIDAIYTELISEAAADDPKLGVALGSDDDQRKRLWHGVRVRVGVHYGMGDIRKDPVSMGYDYYGTVVNTAARVEGVGHGGQVLLTESAFEALQPSFTTKFSVQVIDLGPQPLRGLDSQIRLRQLSPMKFHERAFPPLRLDVENVAAGDLSDATGSDTTEEITAEQMAARVAGMPGCKVDADTILAHYHFLNTGFAAGTDKWRKDTLKALGKSWNVDIHNTPNGILNGLMLIGVKIDLAKPKNGRRASARNFDSHTNRSGTGTNKTTVADFTQQPSVEAFSAPSSPSTALTRKEEVTFDPRTVEESEKPI